MGDVRRRRGGERVYGLTGRGAGLAVWSAPQFPAICRRCPVESGAVAFHALPGIKQVNIFSTRIDFKGVISDN
ncbi:hypothetical protein FNX24_21715 [Salmonella enterica]|nr:hypothetical protein [Salmonella enterica]